MTIRERNVIKCKPLVSRGCIPSLAGWLLLSGCIPSVNVNGTTGRGRAAPIQTAAHARGGSAANHRTLAARFLKLVGEPRWSADGKRLLLRAVDAAQRRWYAVTVKRTRFDLQVEHIVSVPPGCYWMDWAGSSKVLSASRHKGAVPGSIYCVGIADHKTTLLTQGVLPIASPDGTKFFFLKYDASLHVYDLIRHIASTVPAAPGDLAIRSSAPDGWAPDSKKIAYEITTSSGKKRINVALLARNSETRRLVPFRNSRERLLTYGFGWLDPQTLTFPQLPDSLDRYPTFAIYSLSLHGGELRRLTEFRRFSGGFDPSWTIDGSVAYESRKPNEYLVVNLRTGTTRRVEVPGPRSYRLSRNGKWLAAVDMDGGSSLTVVNCGNGHVSRLCVRAPR